MVGTVGRFAAGVALLTLGAGAGFGLLQSAPAGATVGTFTVNDALDEGLAVSGSTSCVAADDAGGCTLRAAIEASENLAQSTIIDVPDPSTVADNASGAYTLDDALGQLDVNDNGFTVTISSTDSTGSPIIEASGSPSSSDSSNATIRDLKVETRTTADISGLTFQNGDPAGGTGGGILNCGTLNLSNSTVTENYANGSGGGITQSSGGSTTLTSVKVTDNNSYGDDGGDGGGGIDVVGSDEASTMTITDSTINDNSTNNDGGGIEISGSDNLATVVDITDSNIDGNEVDNDYGGGISQDAQSTLTVTGTGISENGPPEGDTLWDGGGVSLDPDQEAVTDTFTADAITDNQAYEGGGFALYDTDATIADSAVSGNTASEDAGGIDLETGGTENPTTAVITETLISGNTATGAVGESCDLGDGGGIVSNGDNSLTMTNDTIASNSAGGGGDGGGYYSLDCEEDGGFNQAAGSRPLPGEHQSTDDGSSGTTAFLFDTFAGNQAGDSAGGANIAQENASAITLTNSIVAYGTVNGESTFTNCEADGDGSFTSGGYNLVDDATCGTPAATDIIGPDPLLGTLAANGGPTQTELPETGSPAVNAIPNASCDTTTVTTDQRGLPRPAGPNGTCTIGAVEVQPATAPPPPPPPPPVTSSTPAPTYNPNGYRLAASDGGAFDYGIQFGGSLANVHLHAPIVGLANEPGPFGYLMVASDGGVFSFDGAPFFGSLGDTPLPSPIAAIATTPNGQGYWLVSKAGTVYNLGDAPALTGPSDLNAPVVGAATSPDGKGLWLVSSDGGVFALGDAVFEGSLGHVHLNAPIVGIAPTPNGEGYVLAGADGGVFAFGDAGFHGSTGSLHLNAPVVGIAETNSGGGYWMVASDGGVFAFGDAPFLGSMGGIVLNAPVVGIQHLGVAPG